MKMHTADPLNTLLHTLNEGIAIYIAASAKVDADVHKMLFAGLIENRKFAQAYLHPYAHVEHPALETRHPFGNPLHQAYIALQGLPNNDLNGLYLHLERVENETLKHMQAVIQKTNNIMVLSVIKQLLPRMEAAKARLKTLHTSLAA